MRTLWITGVTGFIGRHLARTLPPDWRAVGLARSAHGPAGLAAYHSVDLTQLDQVHRLAQLDPPTGVIHLAGLYPPASLGELYESNVVTTVTLLLALRQNNFAGRFLSMGTAAEYAQPGPAPLTEESPLGPRSVYGQAKFSQSCLALEAGRQMGIPVVVARPFNLVGPELPEKLVLGALLSQFLAGSQEVVLGNTLSARDFIDVRDLVRGLVPLLERGEAYQAYNFCSGRAVTVEQLCQLLTELTGSQPRLRVDPGRVRADDPPLVVGDHRRVRELLGWTPQIPLVDSVGDMLNAVQHLP